MKRLALRISAKRIGTVSAALLAVVVAASYLAAHRRPLPRLTVCQPVPANVETLGPALNQAQVDTLLAAPDQYSVQVRPLVRPGVTLHEFRTGVTGGHLALRGKCYVGQAVAWIR